MEPRKFFVGRAIGLIVILAVVGAGYFVYANFLRTEPTPPGGNNNNGGDTEERITTKIDQGASAFGVKVIPREVLEDSRCPVDVQCIQAGTVRIRATLESGLGSASQEFQLNQPITTEAEIVTLVDVEPIPYSTVEISDNAYIFYFEIKKR